MIIEEMLLQRYQGVKNEKGVWVTPAFPKLIYVLEEDNIHEDSPYWYLTELAARCTAKRMVPDYISEKKMLELKVDKNGEGHCYTCMGCRSFLTPYIDPKTNKLKLSRKALLPKPEGYVERERRPRPERGERGERRDRGERRERHEHKEE